MNVEIEPATIAQIHLGADGQIIEISADAGGVADGLRRIDPCLHLRYNPAGDYYVVYRLHRDGKPCRSDDPERTEELVLTAQDCDQRIVNRVEYIDREGRGGYDLAKSLEANRAKVDRERQHARHERSGMLAEQMAHELRKAYGVKYKGRVFKP